MDKNYWKRSRIARRPKYALVLALLLVGLVVGTVLAALPAPTSPLVPSGSISPAVWDPTEPKWETGNPSGYSEGETTAMSVWIADGLSGTYQVYLCLEVESGPNPPFEYAFSRFGPWDESYMPTHLPGSNQANLIPTPPYPDGWDKDNPLVYGYGLTITAVSGPEKGTGNKTAPYADCDPNYLGVLVTFTKTTTNAPAWILFGGRLAQAYDPLPPGFANASVPLGKGASSVNGTFQSRIGGTGDKTINFSGSATAPPTADLSIVKSCADWSDSTYSEYTITVSNSGPSSANNLTMTDDLPAELTYTGDWTSKVNGVDAGTCSATDPVTCTLGTLGEGDLWVITLGTTVNANVPIGTDIDNTASVTLDPDIDTNTANDSSLATCTTPVTVSFFSATESSAGVSIDWTTSTETGNVGFNLYAKTGAGLVRLNDELIPSQSVSSTEARDYHFDAPAIAGATYYIESVSVRGQYERKGPFLLDQPYGGRDEVDLIDWEAIRAEHEQKAADRAATAAAAARSNAGRASDSRVEAAAAAGAANVAVKADGIYRITYDQLKAAGLDLKNVPVSALAVTNRGAAVPIYVSGAGSFSSGEYIEFYGQGLTTLHTDVNVYVVQAAANLAERVGTDAQVYDRKAIPPAYYMETLVVDDNNTYADFAPTGDPWINQYVYSPYANYVSTYGFSGVDNYVAGAAPASMTVDLWGGYDQAHRLAVLLNNKTLSNGEFAGITPYNVDVTLPEGTLANGTNSLKLAVGFKGDLIAFDEFSVTYPRAFAARNGGLTFSGAAEVFEVGNLPSANVVVYRVSGDTVERVTKVRTRLVNGTYSAAFRGTATEATYVVAAGPAINAAAALTLAQPDTDITSGTVNTLIVSHPDFINDLATLVGTRTAQGYTVKVVNVDDIYAQYSDGIVDPQAIKAYMTHAINNMGVKMALLVGGDTIDPLNYLGRNGISFIPSLYAATGDLIRFSPVDPLYVDADGNNVPDIAIARLPVRTTTELNNLVAKAVAYAGADYQSTAVFAADKQFTGDSQAMKALMPAGWSVAEAYVGVLGATPARNLLLGEINGGVALTSYFGHSSLTAWTWDNLFTSDYAAGLTNYGKPTIVTQWGCWNTYYAQSSANTMAHKLLLSGNQGAAAVTGATTLTDAKSEALLGNLMMPKLVSGDMTLGDAMQQAKVELAQSDPERLDVLLGWTVLGVPWLEVR